MNCMLSLKLFISVYMFCLLMYLAFFLLKGGHDISGKETEIDGLSMTSLMFVQELV